MHLLIEYWKTILTVAGLLLTTVLGFWRFYVKVGKPLVKIWNAVYKEVTPNGGGSMKDMITKMSKDMGMIKSIQASQLKLNDTPMIQCDSDGRCTMVNKSWSDLSGMQPSEADGWGWLNAVHPDDRDAVKDDFITAVSANSEFNSTYKFKNRITKEEFEVECICIIDRNAKHEVVSIVGTIIRIEPKK